MNSRDVTDEQVAEAFRAFVGDLEIPTGQERGPGDPVDGLGAPPQRHRRWSAPVLVAACVVLILALGLAVSTWRNDTEPPAVGQPGAPVLRDLLPSHSRLTAYAESSPPGPALLAYQHGHGVELFDTEQFVVVGATGEKVRRVEAAEARRSTQGDSASSLLSPDGLLLAVGGHTVPNLVVLELSSGQVRRVPVSASATGVAPVAWSPAADQVWIKLFEGSGLYTELDRDPDASLARVDLRSGQVDEVELAGQLSFNGGVALSPDGAQLAVQTSVGQEVLDTSTLLVATTWQLPGVLVTNGWSPDAGSVLAVSGASLLSQPLVGLQTNGTPVQLGVRDEDLDLALGWRTAHDVLMTQGLGTGGDPTYVVQIDTRSGAASRLSTLDTDWTGSGISGISMAKALAPELVVRHVDELDRGPLHWSWWLPIGGIVLLGLWAVRRLGRVISRRWSTVREEPTGGVPEAAKD